MDTKNNNNWNSNNKNNNNNNKNGYHHTQQALLSSIIQILMTWGVEVGGRIWKLGVILFLGIILL